jgi:hypothetical protein
VQFLSSPAVILYQYGSVSSFIPGNQLGTIRVSCHEKSPEEGGIIFIPNAGNYQPDYMGVMGLKLLS